MTEAAPDDDLLVLDEDGDLGRGMSNAERQELFRIRREHPDWSELELRRELVRRRSHRAKLRSGDIAAREAERLAAHEATVAAVSERMEQSASEPVVRRRSLAATSRLVVAQMADLIESKVLVPSSAKEAAEIAKVFGAIEHQDRMARAALKAAQQGRVIEASGSEVPSGSLQQAARLLERAKARQAAVPVVAGQVRQVGGGDLLGEVSG